MIIKCTYCGYVRKDGTVNSVMFDTERKTFTDNCDVSRFDAFIEAAQSKDVNNLRTQLVENGYRKEERK